MHYFTESPSGYRGRHRDNRQSALMTGEYRDLRSSTERGYYQGKRRTAERVAA